MPDLPVNIDTTYQDDTLEASVKIHQQHHDALHALYNELAGDTPDPNSLSLVTGEVGGILRIRKMTAAAYTALGTKDPNTLYVIQG